jgi:hypothetical protein
LIFFKGPNNIIGFDATLQSIGSTFWGLYRMYWT